MKNFSQEKKNLSLEGKFPPVVFVAINQWNSAFRGDQHIARQFNKFTRVIYFEPIKVLWDDFKYIKFIFSNYTKKENNIFVIQPFIFFPFTRRNERIMKLNYYFFIKKVKKVFLQKKRPILWINNPIFSFMFDILKDLLRPLLICFRWADNWAVFPGSEGYKEVIERNCKYIVQNSDLVFSVSEFLFKKAMGIKRKNVYLLPNGIDESILSKIDSSETIFTEMDKISKPIFCYVGTINSRIRFDWIEKVALAHPQWNFVFIGRIVKTFRLPEKVKFLRNIWFLGEVSYHRLPYYLKKVDVFILPHYKNEVTQAMDPIKLYEYLYTKKPIVASCVVGERFKKFIYIVRNYEEFVQALKQSLEKYDEYLSEERRKIALQHTWTKRMEGILEIMSLCNPLIFEKLTDVF